MWTEEERRRISSEAAGKTVRSLEYEPEGDYWVMEFDDGTEIAIRFMAEITYHVMERVNQAMTASKQASDEQEST